MRFRFDPRQSPSDAFLDYLEGYASAFDLYQVCPRQTFDTANFARFADEFWRLYAKELADAKYRSVDSHHSIRDEFVDGIEAKKMAQAAARTD
jgi:hypothetical protein